MTYPEGYTEAEFMALVLERCGDTDPATVAAFIHDDCQIDGHDGKLYLREDAEWGDVGGVTTQHFVVRDCGTISFDDWHV